MSGNDPKHLKTLKLSETSETLTVFCHSRRTASAATTAAAAADVDLVLVLGDQFLRRALLGVDADRLANVIFVFIHRVAAVPSEKSGVDEIGHQQRRQHRAKSRTDARADEHATNGVTSVRTLRDRLQKRVRRVGVVAIHRRQKRVIAPSPKHFFLQGIPRVLAPQSEFIGIRKVLENDQC